MTKIIGLTGGIATGKSTVSKMFLDEKIPVIDTDEIAKNVLAINTDEYHKVVSLFSNEILQVNGEINRKLLDRIIFSNIQKRNKLNDIVHPKVKQIVLATYAMAAEALDIKTLSSCNKEVIFIVPNYFNNLLERKIKNFGNARK